MPTTYIKVVKQIIDFALDNCMLFVKVTASALSLSYIKQQVIKCVSSISKEDQQ